MLKRIVVLIVAGAFLAAPPAIAKSSSTVMSPAPENVAPEGGTGQGYGGHDGSCPFEDASFEF